MSQRYERALEQPEISIALANSANARLLRQRLSGRFEFHQARASHNDFEAIKETADLVVVDKRNLQRHLDTILQLKASAEPVVLPVLLLDEDRTGPGRGFLPNWGVPLTTYCEYPPTKLNWKPGLTVFCN